MARGATNRVRCLAQPVATETLRSRQAAVIMVALERLLDHVRRGRCAPLFEATLDELDRRLKHLQAAPKGASGDCRVFGLSTFTKTRYQYDTKSLDKPQGVCLTITDHVKCIIPGEELAKLKLRFQVLVGYLIQYISIAQMGHALDWGSTGSQEQPASPELAISGICDPMPLLDSPCRCALQSFIAGVPDLAAQPAKPRLPTGCSFPNWSQSWDVFYLLAQFATASSRACWTDAVPLDLTNVSDSTVRSSNRTI